MSKLSSRNLNKNCRLKLVLMECLPKMDKIKSTFDRWAVSGKSELMEKEHRKTVTKFLNSISFNRAFSFLDVGCGNGWVVRKIAGKKICKKAIGIDKSKKMIKNAQSKKKSFKENYFAVDIQKWNYRGKFDVIFSMESLYYSDSMTSSLRKIFKLLRKNGQFYCGTDFYKDNKATSNWSKKMKIPMHLLSKAEWKKLFEQTGFKTKTRNVKDSSSSKKWKREFGTLFVVGKKESN